MRAFLAALGTFITLSVLPIAAQAEEVDQLIRTMDELSHQTNDTGHIDNGPFTSFYHLLQDCLRHVEGSR